MSMFLDVLKICEIVSIYKDKKATKDGRCWYFKVNYTDAFGKPDQYKSKKFATKKLDRNIIERASKKDEE